MPPPARPGPIFALMFALGSLAAGPLPVSVAQGLEQDRAAASVPSDPAFAALRVDGTAAVGQLRRLDAAGIALAGPGGAELAIPFDGLVRLSREGATAPGWSNEGESVLLPGGDRLMHCQIGAAGPNDLDVHPVGLGKLAVPLNAILGLVFRTFEADESDALEAFEAEVRDAPRDSELLWVAGGDRVAGLLGGIDEKKLTFRPEGRTVAYERARVAALGFNPADVVYPEPKGPYYELTLVDGTRLGLTDVRIERGQVQGRSRFDAPIRFPVGDLAQARAIGGPVAYLSDREATGVQYVAYVGPTRPYRRNANVAGRPIRLGGRAYDRGLGAQSRTLLAYRLEPGARRFQATVGLDDRAGPLGSVAFRVLVDGKARFESPAMAAGEPPRPIDLDLAGGKVLILIAEFGERGDVQDWADWAEARVVR